MDGRAIISGTAFPKALSRVLAALVLANRFTVRIRRVERLLSSIVEVWHTRTSRCHNSGSHVGSSTRIPRNREHGFRTTIASSGIVISVKWATATVAICVILIVSLVLMLVIASVSVITRGAIRIMVCVLLLMLSTMSCKSITITIRLDSIA